MGTNLKPPRHTLTRTSGSKPQPLEHSNVSKSFEQSRNSFSVAEIAERNGLSRQFIRCQIAAGKLRAKKVGRRVLIPAQAEVDWLAAEPQVGALITQISTSLY